MMILQAVVLQRCLSIASILHFYLALASQVSKSAIDCLLRFMKYFFKVLGDAFHSEPLIEVSAEVPSTFATLHRSLGINDSFVKYVVCPSCHSIYRLYSIWFKSVQGV